MEEIWKVVEVFPKYEVSDQGRVRRGERVLKPMWTGAKRKQYATVRLSTDPIQDRKVHHLVLQAFVGPRPPGLVARHLDDDTRNNAAINLAWGAQPQNKADSIHNGTDANIKLSPQLAAVVKVRRESGETGKALAAEYGASQQTICDIFKGRRLVIGTPDHHS